MKVDALRGIVGKLIIILLVSVAVGCKKEDPTTAKIVVINEDGARVPGAVVHMFSAPDQSGDKVQRFDFTNTTDGSGEVIFDLSDYTMPGQTGFAVLDLEVSATIEGVDYDGVGIVKVVEHESVTEDVIVTP